MAANTGRRTKRVVIRTQAAKKSLVDTSYVFVPTNQNYVRFCNQSVNRLTSIARSRSRVALVSTALLADERPVKIVVSRLSDLTSEIVSALRGFRRSRQVVFVNKFPIEAVAPRLMELRIRRSNRLHLTAKPTVLLEAELINRLVIGVSERDGSQTIVDAWTEDDVLVLLSPSFERMRIPHVRLGRFLGNSPQKISRFEIDEDGRFLHWPHSDTHLGWKQLEQLINPAIALKDQMQSEEFRVRYGSAIRQLRESSGLTQAEINGLTDRQLRRIEHGQQMVTTKALQALSKAHCMEAADYMREIGRISES